METTQNLIVTDELLDSIRDRISAGDDENSRDSMAKVAWIQANNAKSGVERALDGIKDQHKLLVNESARAIDYGNDDRPFTSSSSSYAERFADFERERVASLKQLADAMRILVAGGYVDGAESFNEARVA
jgi:hypothetical protein